MTDYLSDTLYLGLTLVLIVLNGFFVAAEFALVKVSKSKIKTMQRDGNPVAGVALWLYQRQSKALSACQMGITMASLGLGWIGEPALAHLIRPMLEGLGLDTEVVIHGVAFALAFTVITALHIVIGEQVPKIYAIRKPVKVVGWSAYPLKLFYRMFYPFMWLLDRVSAWLLRFVGIESNAEHETSFTEEEIRASLSIAHNKGDLTKSEHRLLDAAFRFDDQVAKQIMLPRNEVVFFDLADSVQDNIEMAQRTRHTRFPLCEGSLDKISGVVHIKDLLGKKAEDNKLLIQVARKPVFVPESLPAHHLMGVFQETKQHLAFVEDEYGTVVGIVTMELLLEQLVGQLQDEFDTESPDIVKEGPGRYTVEGDVPVSRLNELMDIRLSAEEVDTLSGLLVEHTGHYPVKGEKIILQGEIMAEVLTVKQRRATKVRLILPEHLQINETEQ